jgi:central kinetochore subunit Mis15/CHL4
VVGGRREERAVKRARLVARARFGETAVVGDGMGVERVDVVVEDKFPDVGGVDRGEDGGDRAGRGGGRSRVGRDFDGAADDEEDDDAVQDEAAQGWRPYVRLTFHGSHVFAGIRQLVECGIVDGERMPGWMTGEEGVTIGAVRNGRIRGHKGSGL